jgi:hypothetical protein
MLPMGDGYLRQAWTSPFGTMATKLKAAPQP